MANEAENLLHSLQLLLPMFLDDHHISTKPTENINVMNALVDDMGHRMYDELRVIWRNRITQAVEDCDKNIYDLPEGMQHLYAGTLRELHGRFFELVEKDYLAAGRCYEEAAKTTSLISKDILLLDVKNLGLQNGGIEEEAKNYLSDPVVIQLLLSELPDISLTVVSLWDRAADAYFMMMKEGADNARRCYELGIETIKALYPEVEEAGKLVEMDRYLCHLSLSLANLLTVFNDEWEKTEDLCREAADTIFFNKAEKSNDQYSDLCSIINNFGATSFSFSRRQECVPYEQTLFHASRHKDNFLKLAAELGQKALDELIKEYDRKKRFPVPETFYLVGILSYIYRDLGQHEKCINLVPPSTSFGSYYWEWAWDQLEYEVTGTPFEWVHPHVVHCRELFFAEGLLQRPDYKEFVDHIKKLEDTHRNQERQLMQHEEILLKSKKLPNVQDMQSKLLHEYPWLNNIVNPGSVMNAENLYQWFEKQNWAEVVMGFCNAVEAEVKQFVYKEYLAFRAGFSKLYAEESERQRNEGAVLSFIASTTRKSMTYKIWELFVNTKMSEHKEFLLKEFPGLLSQLVPIRNKAAHGEKIEKKNAEQVRKIVLGKPSVNGLLERLHKIR